MPPIAATDLDQNVVSTLKANFKAFNGALNAQGMTNIEVQAVCGDVFKIKSNPNDKQSVLTLLNPPYGRRLGRRSDAAVLYRKLGNHVASFPSRVAGLVCAPSLAVAAEFCSHLRNFAIAQRPFNHGGRTVYLVMFCRS